ncbi:MAG: hypothetical protein DMF93_12125 [Acidobacteria bacterium]|nr:MAG: hypothetical protein DMF93_12125 [Acidobacteriota bacterium]
MDVVSTLFFRTLSQGLQAFAPVAVACVWCSQVGRRRSRTLIARAAWLAALITVPASWWFQRSATRALDEAALASVALTIAIACAAAVVRAGDRPRPTTSVGPSGIAALAVVAATIVIVVRQTIEIGSVLEAAAFELRSRDATAVILAGAAIAGAIAWTWTRVGRALSPESVATVSMSFAIVFVCELVVYTGHEWAEARMLPWSDAVHGATEAYGPDGMYGVHFSDLLILVPIAAVAWTHARRHFEAFKARAPRRLVAGSLVAFCSVFMGLQHTDAPPLPPMQAASAAAIGAALSRPHVLFRDTAPGPGFGRLAIAPLDDLAARLTTTASCQRVSFAAGRGLCLHVERGLLNTYSAVPLSDHLKPGTAIKLQGLPSRTRIAPDGRVGAITVFVVGDDYAAEFSTRTTIVDLSSGDEIGELEQFGTWKNGQRFRATDFNFWGVTFARDGTTFYASLRTAGMKYLVRGELALRKLSVVRENAECPSLSPDNRLLAYKKRVGPSPDSWRIHVLDLASNVERVLDGETRYVDDQVEWLDQAHVLYAIPRRTTSIADVWVLPVDGSAPAKLFLPEAESPIVVR